ncbi:hypothetical protein AAJP47_06755 [Psychrobacter sp. B38]|uniref:hypothetical protein n=1 Tax=Psychrobacter sp. B38 TaxID=3143538 RepID=UPI00320C226E
MQTFERIIDLEGKNARYYDLSDLGQKDKNAKSIPAHFYGGNGFAAGVYMPLLSKLSARFDISSLAMRGYWQDLPTLKKLTREQDAEVLIAFLEKNTRQTCGRYWSFSRRDRHGDCCGQTS